MFKVPCDPHSTVCLVSTGHGRPTVAERFRWQRALLTVSRRGKLDVSCPLDRSVQAGASGLARTPYPDSTCRRAQAHFYVRVLEDSKAGRCPGERLAFSFRSSLELKVDAGQMTSVPIPPMVTLRNDDHHFQPGNNRKDETQLHLRTQNNPLRGER